MDNDKDDGFFFTQMHGPWDFDNALSAVADPDCTPEVMADFYASCCRADPTDAELRWGAINKAILLRWGHLTLVWIKKAAYKKLGRRQSH